MVAPHNLLTKTIRDKMTKEQAITHFSVAYLQVHCLHIPVKAVRSIIENKVIETHNAFCFAGTTWKLNK